VGVVLITTYNNIAQSSTAVHGRRSSVGDRSRLLTDNVVRTSIHATSSVTFFFDVVENPLFYGNKALEASVSYVVTVT
jgi:hypothetical protein